MHNLWSNTVVKLWATCGLVAGFYTSRVSVLNCMCRSSVFVRKLSTTNTQAFPHINFGFNRLVLRLTHITHRTNKNYNELYKLITIN